MRYWYILAVVGRPWKYGKWKSQTTCYRILHDSIYEISWRGNSERQKADWRLLGSGEGEKRVRISMRMGFSFEAMKILEVWWLSNMMNRINDTELYLKRLILCEFHFRFIVFIEMSYWDTPPYHLSPPHYLFPFRGGNSILSSGRREGKTSEGCSTAWPTRLALRTKLGRRICSFKFQNSDYRIVLKMRLYKYLK